MRVPRFLIHRVDQPKNGELARSDLGKGIRVVSFFTGAGFFGGG